MLARLWNRCMLSVVIPTHDSGYLLLPTLAALVAGAAAGLVREVIVADAGSQDATAEIADAAGCRLLRAPGGHEARLARRRRGGGARPLAPAPATGNRPRRHLGG
jgi:glycosyltransferase involved in cell wall biosynthesis